MLLEIKCSSCGKGDYLTINENEYMTVLICKNLDCPNFNCFSELNAEFFNNCFSAETNDKEVFVTVKEGFTGEIEFEDEDHEDEGDEVKWCKWKERFENGIMVDSKKSV